MKPLLLLMGCCLASGVQAQNVGIGTSSPNSNAKLDITATDKGILIPRMDSTHRKAISNTVGLLVYDSSTNSFWYNNGNAWQNMAVSASGWSLTGNAGIDTSRNFLGTTDNTALLFKVNNQPAGKITATGADVTAFGSSALQKNVYQGSGGGSENSAFGSSALSSNTSGQVNTAVGFLSLAGNTTGSTNTAVGAETLVWDSTGSGNVAVGYRSLYYNSGSQNTAIGNLSLASNGTGENNTAVGAFSMNANTTGTQNTAIGTNALQHNLAGNANSVLGIGAAYGNKNGNNNTALGTVALTNNQNGSNNTAVGASSSVNSGGSGNTSVGNNALSNNFDGNNNTALGYNADFPSLTQLSNAAAIGANAKVDASNKIRLGDANVTVVESNGVFNTVSDGRFKYNIQENVKGLDFILKLRPVTYQFDTKKQEDFSKGNLSTEQLNSQAIPAAYNETNNIKRTGFIAQEVAAAAQKTGYDFDGVKIPATDKQYYSLSYASFVVPLVKAVQEQQQTINVLEKQNELLQRQNELIMKRLEALEKK